MFDGFAIIASNDMKKSRQKCNGYLWFQCVHTCSLYLCFYFCLAFLYNKSEHTEHVVVSVN